MIPRYICSAIFLVLLATNVMQGEAMPGALFEEGLPNAVNVLDYPGVGEVSNNVASAAASAASTAYNGFRNYYDNLRTGYGPNLVIPSRYRLWNRYGVLPNALVSGFGAPAAWGLPGYIGGYPLGNYGGAVDSAASATATASSVASGTDSGLAVAPNYYGGYYGYPGYFGRIRNYGRGLGNAAAAAAAAAASSAATDGIAKR